MVSNSRDSPDNSLELSTRLPSDYDFSCVRHDFSRNLEFLVFN
jgi:hypothetical protein